MTNGKLCGAKIRAQASEIESMRKTMQLALNALEAMYSVLDHSEWDGKAVELFKTAIAALEKEVGK